MKLIRSVMEMVPQDKPICRPDQKKIYGVARNEAAEILCQVDAYPPPESFKWSFNNTAETIDMPQSGYRVHAEQASSLTYTPVKELDYGTIMCWADNVVGQQKEPCVFHLIAAGKPEMPYNCSLVNQTSESLEVDCAEGVQRGGPGATKTPRWAKTSSSWRLTQHFCNILTISTAGMPT
uniref:Uncharacterized protein n=1 Tax=Anopheles atroparvus TaxID=41427 RepID=A0A182JJ81_ANOAO